MINVNSRSKTYSVKHNYSCVNIDDQYGAGTNFAVYRANFFRLGGGGGMVGAFTSAKN